MPFKPHPDLVAPRHEEIIWRYMDIAKLLSLLDKRALYFTRLDQLGQLDPFEGYYTNANVAVDQLSFNDLPANWKIGDGAIVDEKTWDAIRQNGNQLRQFAKAQREMTFVNSWHVQPHESAAMWSQYLKSQDGIAVQSTYGRLCDSFKGYEDFDVFIGTMRYLDYDKEVIPTRNILYPFLSKRRSFEHEKELRCLIWTPQDGKNNLTENKFKNVNGIYVSIEIPVLIQKIFVAPTAPTWVSETIASVVGKLGLKVEVVQSDLLAVPLY
jgi:hypothetical protein